MISDIKFLFWNCQGCGHPRFHNLIKEYVLEFHLDVICLFETRVSGQKVDSIIWISNFFSCGGFGFCRWQLDIVDRQCADRDFASSSSICSHANSE